MFKLRCNQDPNHKSRCNLIILHDAQFHLQLPKQIVCPSSAWCKKDIKHNLVAASVWRYQSSPCLVMSNSWGRAMALLLAAHRWLKAWHHKTNNEHVKRAHLEHVTPRPCKNSSVFGCSVLSYVGKSGVFTRSQVLWRLHYITSSLSTTTTKSV